MPRRVAPSPLEDIRLRKSARSYQCFPLIACPPLHKGLTYRLIRRNGSVPQIAATGRTQHAHGPHMAAAQQRFAERRSDKRERRTR